MVNTKAFISKQDKEIQLRAYCSSSSSSLTSAEGVSSVTTTGVMAGVGVVLRWRPPRLGALVVLDTATTTGVTRGRTIIRERISE
jgi:hypothetical protein